jgi:uncharacterized repeat protein (TIGR01451 family)
MTINLRRTRGTRAVLRLVLGLALGISLTGVLQSASPQYAHAATPTQIIASAGPLNQIFVGNDLSAQIAHTGDSAFEVYPPGVTPGDDGTFLVVNNTLYAPNLTAHGGTATTGWLGTYFPFAPVSQTAVTGSGTTANPFQVVTTVDVGTTGLHIAQTDSYVVGQESYSTSATISNSTGTAQSAILYSAMDCYLGGSDQGFGFVQGSAPSCTVNPNNSPAGRIEQLVPLTGGNNYVEAHYNTVWTDIGAHSPLPNTCDCAILNPEDNGQGISWNTTIPAGGQVTYSHITNFSPLGQQVLTTTKTADSPTANAGGPDGYTISVANPNATSVVLNSIVDTLPAGFSYVSGSSTGVTTLNPAVSGQTLTWTGPFTDPAAGALTLHFRVTVAATPGTYFNNAGANAAGGYTVLSTGNTAPVVVSAAGTLTTTKTADSPTANAGGADGYTISVANPNAVSVVLNTIVDTLPAGFSYVSGSSSGATTLNPAVSGQTLTWTGPFTDPAAGAVMLHFGVTAATAAGTYFNNAGASAAGGFTVAPTGNTAPVVVGSVIAGTCNVTAKLRGPFYINGTYTAEPSIDAQISRTLGGLHRELFTSTLGSVNVQNAQTTSCGNVGTASASATFTGTASGGSGAYSLGDVVTTTLADSSPTTITEVTDIWNAAHTIQKTHSVGIYNDGPNSYLITS